jgi:rSAM/selenodomain-associated transferase 1
MTPGMGGACVRLLLKRPDPGRVKTRLAAEVGDAAAVRIYRALVERQVESLDPAWRGVVHVDPPGSEGEMRAWLGTGLEYVSQSGGNLGERLESAMAEHFSGAAAGPLLFLGGDCPDLDRVRLAECFAALAGADVVVVPARDGGYCAVGMNARRTELFRDMPWSTERLCAVTLRRAAELGLRVAVLAEAEDVDDAASWRRARAAHPSLRDAG